MRRPPRLFPAAPRRIAPIPAAAALAALVLLAAAPAWGDQLPGDTAPPAGVGGAVAQPVPNGQPTADPNPDTPGTTAESGTGAPDLASPGGSIARQPGPPGTDRRPTDAPASMVPGLERTEPGTTRPVPPAEGDPARR